MEELKVKSERKSRALFLDRDGIINIDHGYVHRKEDFEFVDGIFDLCKFASNSDYRLIIITNQAGIGRGYYNEYQFEILTDWMCSEFISNGVKIDKVYFSPYHPEHGLGIYKQDHESRKPNPGMIKKAEFEFNIDLSKSVLVGDKYTDVLAGYTAGVSCNILVSNIVPEHLHNINYFRVQNLKEVSLIISKL